jgi:hypothetical protein
MKRIILTFLFWALILSGCSTGAASPQPPPISTTEAPTVVPTTAVPSDNQPCGYQWAYQELPELSSSFQQSIQALQAEAQARAFAFGENCVRADRSVAGFTAMETDFDVTLQVSDVSNESDLGEWIMKVMQVVLGIPQEQIVGPQPGRVTMIFQSGADQKIVNFYIHEYQDLPAGLSNAEIFQALEAPQ